MNVAIVHDYIKEYGGAERVLEALHEIYPKAPVYTAFYFPEFLGPHRKRFEKWNIIPSFLQKIPFSHKLISPLRLFTPYVFEQFDFSQFDVVIVSQTGAYFPNMIVTPQGAVHICYSHTPPRYLYGYPTARDWKKHFVGRVLGEFMNYKLRPIDFLSSQRVDKFIANSIEVKGRIEKFYRRDATVIYPPVSMVDDVSVSSDQKREYYVTGGRLARAKRIDLVIEACNALKLPLKIFGKGFAGYESELRALAGTTIEFVGEVSDSELINLYSHANALLYASEYEDFGIMPVEAQACGTPVVALKQGGVKETIIDGNTGVFFDEPSTDSLMKAIRRFNNLMIKGEECVKNVQRFSKDRFKKELQQYIERSAHANS